MTRTSRGALIAGDSEERAHPVLNTRSRRDEPLGMLRLCRCALSHSKVCAQVPLIGDGKRKIVPGKTENQDGDQYSNNPHSPYASSRSVSSSEVSVEERPCAQAQSSPIRDQDDVYRPPHTL